LKYRVTAISIKSAVETRRLIANILSVFDKLRFIIVLKGNLSLLASFKVIDAATGAKLIDETPNYFLDNDISQE
jgi:hypothetical protein